MLSSSLIIGFVNLLHDCMLCSLDLCYVTHTIVLVILSFYFYDCELVNYEDFAVRLLGQDIACHLNM